MHLTDNINGENVEIHLTFDTIYSAGIIQGMFEILKHVLFLLNVRSGLTINLIVVRGKLRTKNIYCK